MEARMASTMESVADRSRTHGPTARRRFGLLDAMILVAATAAGLAAAQWLDTETEGAAFRWPLLEAVHEGDVLQASASLWFLAEPVVAGWTLALIPIRLLGPRPRWRHLARQPGFQANCAAALALGAAGVPIALVRLAFQWGRARGPLVTPDLLLLVSVTVGLAILASWMTLLVGRRWRAEPSWVDRLGRALGVVWILAGTFVPGGFVSDWLLP
jgi:hypothetical protein